MALSNDDIKKIGNLSRLKLSDAEVARYRRDFSNILKYVDQLTALKLPPVKASASPKAAGSGAGSRALLRSDRVAAWVPDERRSALDQFPEKQGGQLKVKRIL